MGETNWSRLALLFGLFGFLPVFFGRVHNTQDLVSCLPGDTLIAHHPGLFECHGDGAVSVLVLDVNVGSVGEQDFDHLQPSKLDSKVERRGSLPLFVVLVLSLAIDVSATGQQRLLLYKARLYI